VTEPISERAARLRDQGYKLTHARLTVLGALESSGGHITSAELLERVNQADDSIGRASVFRALDLFTRLNLVRPTYIDSSMTPTYVLMPDGHHHHIVCVDCGKVIEFDECGLSALTRQLEQEFHLTIQGHLLEFYARCQDCAAAPVRAD
jgi:Fe2+ or Zn2+ uptake regulation protein